MTAVIRHLALTSVIVLLAATFAWAAPAQAATVDDSCYFVVRIPAGASAKPSSLPASVRAKVATCASALKAEGYRGVARLGKAPTAVERGWQAAVLKEFVRNGCTDISDRADRSRTCQVFAEEWPFVFGSKAPRPGTIQMFAFEPV